MPPPSRPHVRPALALLIATAALATWRALTGRTTHVRQHDGDAEREATQRRAALESARQAFLEQGRTWLAGALARLPERVPIGAAELRSVTRDNARADRMSDAALIAIALAAVDLDSAGVATMLSVPVADVGRWWVDPAGMPLAARSGLAVVLTRRSPHSGPIADELQARTSRRIRQAINAAADVARAQLSPTQVDAWAETMGYACLTDGTPVVRALSSLPPDVAERKIAAFGRELVDANARRRR